MSGFGHRVWPGIDMDPTGPLALSRKDLNRLEILGLPVT